MLKARRGVTIALSVIGCVILFWLGNKLSYQIRTDASAGRPLNELLERFWIDLANPLHISLNQVDLIVGLAFVGFGSLLSYSSFLSRKQDRRGEEHGSAQWAKHREMVKYANSRSSSNLLFTKQGRLSLNTYQTQRNLNTLVIGSAGSGKSRYFVLPNLAQAETSYVITDPKGELHRASSDYLRSKGYKVRAFNLIDFSQSETFNPFAYFNEQQPEVSCSVFAHMFILNGAGKRQAAGDEFWQKAERALLTALVAFVYFSRTNPTLTDVLSLHANIWATERGEGGRGQCPTEKLFHSARAVLAGIGHDLSAYSPDVARRIQGLRFACAQYNVFEQGSGETRKGILISLGVSLSPLHIPAVQNLVRADSLELTEAAHEKTALFLILPDTHTAFSFLASTFYESFFDSLMYDADHDTNGGRLPIQCFMDEFANIGVIPNFEKRIAVMRSRGISVNVILQTYSQGKDLYRDSWETIVGNCDSLLFLGGTEPSTTKYIAERIGKQTVHTLDHSANQGNMRGSQTTAMRKLGRELITVDELGRLPSDKAIWLLRGEKPFLDRKLDAPVFS